MRSKESRWNDRFQELTRFKNKYGHCIVPTKFKPNPSLGCWVSTQRVHHKRMKVGRHTSLTEEKIKKLNSIGFIWDASDIPKHEAVGKKVAGLKRKKKSTDEKEMKEGAGKRINQSAWLDMYQKLKDYKEENGNTLVPSKYKNKSLANWVAVQRRNYREAKTSSNASKRMNEERIALLEEIGFDSDSKKRNDDERKAEATEVEVTDKNQTLQVESDEATEEEIKQSSKDEESEEVDERSGSI